ncbi:hypothetical protein EVAR_30113_1 [Eumeta japonica]|uniref:Uncharacterized protein n=1 Tax=Eumeta variegata TaxID=151549 RepID=A0A4C1WJW8_EUMVA|nr:hypothetical protein EVAR_30113_1 [Eumeta japonica]
MGRFRPAKYHTLAEYGGEVTASGVAFRSVSERVHSSSTQLPSPSISPVRLHQISYSYSRDRQRSGDSSGGLRMSMGGGDHLIFDGSYARWPLDML